MAVRHGFSKLHWIWISIVLATLLGGITMFLWPESFPEGELQKLLNNATDYDVVIVFNPGGWGNATLAEATDFAPILERIQQDLTQKGFTSIIIPYARTPGGFTGTITGIKEYLNSFRAVSEFQAKDIESLAAKYPDKYIVMAGFSNGGALTDRVTGSLENHSRLCSVIAGVPGWYPTHNTPSRLVLNNNGKDPLAAADIKTIAINVIKAPFRWIEGKLTGKKITLGTAFHFPGHEYTWDSPEVGPVVKSFLERNFKSG